MKREGSSAASHSSLSRQASSSANRRSGTARREAALKASRTRKRHKRVAGGNEWDVWDNFHYKWTPTGIPCNPIENGWNHLTVQVARTSNNQLLYQSLTFNGVTHNLNWTFAPSPAPGWWGITVNYQMDGDHAQSPYTVYVDQLNFTYQ